MGNLVMPVHAERPQQQGTTKSHPAKPQVSSAKGPTCKLGVYPVKLYEFDMAKNTFRLSFYAWCRTSDKDYRIDKRIEITNATTYEAKPGQLGKNGAEYFGDSHFFATILHHWNIRYFPFDRQLLEVRLEDVSDVNTVIFEPDHEHSHLHKEIVLEGWHLLGMKLKPSTTTYATNFGDTSTKEALFSRVTMQVEIKREGWRTYFNNFIGFFVAAFLALIIYVIDPRDLNSRGNLSLGAIFTSVGNKYVIDQRLPVTSYFTMADSIQIATFLLISITILNFIILKRLEDQMPAAAVQRINYWVGIGAGLIYILWIGIHTLVAVLS